MERRCARRSAAPQRGVRETQPGRLCLQGGQRRDIVLHARIIPTRTHESYAVAAHVPQVRHGMQGQHDVLLGLEAVDREQDRPVTDLDELLHERAAAQRVSILARPLILDERLLDLLRGILELVDSWVHDAWAAHNVRKHAPEVGGCEVRIHQNPIGCFGRRFLEHIERQTVQTPHHRPQAMIATLPRKGGADLLIGKVAVVHDTSAA